MCMLMQFNDLPTGAIPSRYHHPHHYHYHMHHPPPNRHFHDPTSTTSYTNTISHPPPSLLPSHTLSYILTLTHTSLQATLLSPSQHFLLLAIYPLTYPHTPSHHTNPNPNPHPNTHILAGNATLTLSALRTACNIPECDLKRHLLSLCTPKLKILKKASKGKVISRYSYAHCLLYHIMS